MTQRLCAGTLALLLVFSTICCGGFQPLRAPRSDLWRAARIEPPEIILPAWSLATASGYAGQGDVLIVIQLLDKDQTQALCHADLMRHGIQPILLAIHNGGSRAYGFRKRDVTLRVVPAATAAKRLYTHPARTLAEQVRWLVFLLPGAFVESFIEPLTFDFPGIEEAAQRPAWPNHRGISDAFLRRELVDGLISPDQTRAGILFVRPFPLGRPITVQLDDVTTHQPPRIDVPTPLPVFVERRTYRRSLETVWLAAVKAASGLTSWRVVSRDPLSRTLVARSGARIWGLANVVQITVTIQRMSDRVTEVRVESTLPSSLSTAYGRRSPRIGQFFDTLDHLLPQPKPAPRAATAPAQTTPAPSRRFGPRSKIERPESPPAY